MNLNPSFQGGILWGSRRSDRHDVVAMLHELYTVYPRENHAVLAQALLQARKNLSPNDGVDAVLQEVARLLGILTVLRLKADEELLHRA
jgi:hypothetical protein